MPAAHLDANDLASLQRSLREWGLIAGDEEVATAGRAGEGNMNLALRVRTDRRSIVVKQARPWVEKYPSIPAPEGRSEVEVAFYETVAQIPSLAAAMPTLLASDAASCTLALQDLGSAPDLTGVYGGLRLEDGQLDALGAWLSTLHGRFAGVAVPEVLVNREMRELNHEHIFVLPYVPDNGLELDRHTPGLQETADALLDDGAIAGRAARLGERYLADRGCTLLHGDYFPGSWLAGRDGRVWVIDPEFCFVGDPEWDLGILRAHLELSGHAPSTWRRLLDGYRPGIDIDPALVRAYAGVEVLRRLLGVSQLPLDVDLPHKHELLQRGRALLLDN